MNALDPIALRNAFGSFMTGVTIVTALRDDGTPVGFTANSFSSVSLDPPLLLVCPGKFLSQYDAFATCKHFAISVLGEGQEDASNIFASSSEDRFAQVAHSFDLHRVPVIDGAIAQFSCTTHQVVDAGDHAVLIGHVRAFDAAGGAGLGYVGGRYFHPGLERAALEHADGTSVCGALVEMGDALLLEKTAQGYVPIQVRYRALGDLLPALRAELDGAGLEAEIGLTYSVFEDTSTGLHSTYFLATAQALPETDTLHAVPIADLAEQAYATPAIKNMLLRFALEARTRNFALYLGDAEQGATHPLR